MGTNDLTPRAVRVMAKANLEAKERGHSFVGTEHLLLALAQEEHGVARRVLDELGVADEVAERVRGWMDSDDYRSRLPSTPE